MRRSSLLSLALLFVAAAAFAVPPAAPTVAPQAPALQAPIADVAAPAAPATLPAFLASLAKSEGSAQALLPNRAPGGAHFVDVDWECVSWCQQDYLQCAQGCSACDQCSCQFAYCVSGCGIPFQGC